MTEPFMPQVKNIVYLMLENRSLDNLLGWLYTPMQGWACPSAPLYVYPRGSSSNYMGLTQGKYSNPDPDSGESIPVVPLSDSHWQSDYAVPYLDPFEALRAYPSDPRASDNWKGVMNQFFGNKNLITGLPSESDGEPEMKGFLQDYKYWRDFSWDGKDILWTYTPTQANVINSIALQYAVSDRWFCSVPSETTPNRAYSICGTSLGRETNSPEIYYHSTIFNAIGSKKSWGIYGFDLNYKSKKMYTDYTFPHISKAPNGEFGNISKFLERASAGTLPAFSYLEPKWTSIWTTGNDYHPNSRINPGESFLKEIYNAVRSGLQWSNTLFIITFDEHGGTYDHVPPPWGALNPDGQNGNETGFKFNLFGARVPTILVSPFVNQSTVFRAPEENIKLKKYPFDHTSFIATLLKWAGVYDSQKYNFGNRVLEAQTFEGVLADHPVNNGNIDFNEQLTASPSELSETQYIHPAGKPELIWQLLKELPFKPARRILDTCNTLDEIKAEVERYTKETNTGREGFTDK